MAAPPLELPPIVQPATAEHHPGKIIFVELVTPDIAAAKKFYGGLLGWTFQDLQRGDIKYAEALLDGHPVAGLIQKEMRANERRQPAWLSFFAVRDADEAKRTALQNGAKLLFGPRDVPLRGKEAVFADPRGAVFAVLASGSGDPADVLADPGKWIWSSLHTDDPDAGAAFYQKLFDYEVFELPSTADSEHLLLASDNCARASVNSLGVKTAKTKSYWINYLRVEDVARTAVKVVALGGRVLVQPHEDRDGGKVAVVSDPQGAHFGLLQWAENENREVAP